jgi:predicted O-methyltransferase YrrM
VDIVHPEIDRYLHDLADPSDPILREMEVLAAERSFPIVGPQVGRLLHLVAKSIGARRVIELGSGFGYSAYWFALAVGHEGRVVMTEGSPDLAAEAAEFLRRGGLADRVRIEVGDALEIAERLGGVYDIVFTDIDKEQYPQVLDLARQLLRPGGLLICDNMLWFGTVLDPEPRPESTRGVVELTRRLRNAPDFDSVCLPLRDGVMLSHFNG